MSSDPNAPESLNLPRAAAVTAVVIAGLALVGWVAGVVVLRTFGGAWAMNPSTAVALVCAGAALWMLLPDDLVPRKRMAGRGLAAIAGLIGLGRLLEYAVGWPIGVDHWFLSRAAAAATAQMAPTTTIDLVLMAVAEILIGVEYRRVRPADVLGLVTVLLAVPALLAPVTSLLDLASAGLGAPMAFNTSLAFIALGLGIAGARPKLGLVGRMRESHLRIQVTIGLGLTGAMLVVVGLVAAWSSVQSQRAAVERRGVSERRGLLDHMLGTLVDAETGQRGYMLTGDTAFLEPYTAVFDSIDDRIGVVRNRYAAYPDRASRIALLDSLTRFKLSLISRTVALRRQGNEAAALAIVRDGAGKRTMDEAQEVVQSLQRDEAATYDVWDARLHVADRLTLLTSASGILLTAVFLAFTLLAINRSIAGRELAEAAARESEQRIFRMLEALPVAVFVMDANGKKFYTNRASQAILGEPRNPSAVGNALPETYQVYVAGTNQIYPAERTGAIRALTGERVHLEDMELHRAGGVVPLEVWAAPVYDSAGDVLFAVSVFNDITERRKAEAEIRDLNDQLKGSIAELTGVNHELEAFTYSVSHDLRAPVRHMDGFSRLLEEALGPRLEKEHAHFLSRIRSGARQMGSLIDDLLRLSRVGRQGLIVKQADLNQVLRSVVYDLRDETAGREIEWRISSLAPVECDPTLVRQVFVNLIANALKFTRTRKKAVIEVADTPVDGGRAVMVRDNGVGFDMRYVDKLFGVFQRLHPETEFEGTGVGLAIVQRIVHKHGGRVWVEGKLDEGATFYFTLAAERA